MLKFLILGSILDHIFGPKKDKLFWTVFVFQGDMSGAICNIALYLQSEGLNISWIYPGTIPLQCLKMIFTIQYSTLPLTRSQFIFLKYDGSVWDIRGKFRQKWIQLFWGFWIVWILIFSLQEENIWNIHNQNVTELAHYLSLLYVGVRYLLWRYRKFSSVFIFSKIFEAITSPLIFESSWLLRYSTLSSCLMEWLAKDILISLKHLVFEKRMDLVFSEMKWHLIVYEPLA